MTKPCKKRVYGNVQLYLANLEMGWMGFRLPAQSVDWAVWRDVSDTVCIPCVRAIVQVTDALPWFVWRWEVA